jgi:hypothetical protein
VEEYQERVGYFPKLYEACGGGWNSSFWHDLWCGDTVLKVAFLVLFDIAYAKDASVFFFLDKVM